MSSLALLTLSPPSTLHLRAARSRPSRLRPSQSPYSLPLRPSRPGPFRFGPVRASYRPPVPATDRLISAISYTLPLLNSLHYGRFLFAQAPQLATLIEPILPLAAAYRSIPYAAFVAFFALYLAVARNPSLSRFSRFNAMQAVVLDVLLALPALALRVLGMPSRGIGLKLLEYGYGGMFLFVAGCFVYGVVSCVVGRTPYIPVVAAAADRQL